MKLLLIHSDHISYEVKEKAIAQPEEIEKKHDEMTDALTVFIAVEKQDEKSPQQAINKAHDEILKTAEQLNVSNIMLYPYAHLSSDLASAKKAKDILSQLEKNLVKNTRYTVRRSPFGWYKAFTLSCKGHPLSELSREIIPGEERSYTASAIAGEGTWKNAPSSINALLPSRNRLLALSISSGILQSKYMSKLQCVFEP